MAEIEVSSDPQRRKDGGGTTGVAAGASDVFSAAVYGDLEKLRNLVERDGLPVSKPDGNGYYAIQWAALNNFPDVVQYIIEHGGDVNAADHRQQTALHWAAVKGSIMVADVLVQSGARVEAADIDGYRAVHVAAQYGQTSFLNHITTKYSAEFDAPDNDGRSPLHWAAYKGYTDTVRLLLFRDAHQGRQDLKGCTPLHWAALSGNVETCTVLVHAGNKAELLVKDESGFTPAQLAAESGQRHATTPEYKAYQEQVLRNCTKFSQRLLEKGYELVSGGTDNHLVLVNLKNQGIDGSRVEKVMELVHIAANKNTVPGDVSAMVPGGIRMGTPALTSRGFVEEDFVKVADFFDTAVKLALKIKAETKGGSKLKDFVATIQTDGNIQSEIAKVRHEVEEYAKQFPTIGFEKETMKYRD